MSGSGVALTYANSENVTGMSYAVIELIMKKTLANSRQSG